MVTSDLAPPPRWYRCSDGWGFTCQLRYAAPGEFDRVGKMYEDPPWRAEIREDTMPELPDDHMATAAELTDVTGLPHVLVPEESCYDLRTSAVYVTGPLLVERAVDSLERDVAPGVVAIDIETMGLGAEAFSVKCLTAAWETGAGTVSVLLDVARRDHDCRLARRIIAAATELVLHNAAFDVPPLHHVGVLSIDDVAKVVDTVVYARLAFPDVLRKKSLEALAPLADFPSAEVTMSELFKANKMTISDGFREFDIDRPVYRRGAMSDTVATLRLLPVIRAAAWDRLVTDNPLSHAPMALDSAGAVAVMEREQRVNRIMLRRSARGLGVDVEHLDRFAAATHGDVERASRELTAAGVDPDAGNVGGLVVAKLDEQGELPPSWPRTATGKLKATKDDLAGLDHPLARDARRVAELRKVLGYLSKVREMHEATGRLHPSVSVLGASATGRMSYSSPELQQFPTDARPIIVHDEGLTSVDWSQIEPVVMANAAGDVQFLAPFERGEDLYAPIQAAAGVTRKTAKVLLLAAMYGQGRTSMAAALGIDVEHAAALQDGMWSAMPATGRFVGRLRSVAETYRAVITAAGRVLPVPTLNGQVAAYKGVNYFCQGSAYDVLSDTLIRLDDAGIADHVHLAMHDELVVSTAVGAEVEEIMRTPPDFLLRWTGGRTPVFRCDRLDLGRAWREA